MASTTTRLTVDDFERLPYEETRGRELVNGELVDVSGNNPKHIVIRDFFIEMLRPIVRQGSLGRVLSEAEYDFDSEVHAPDVSFVRAERVSLLNMTKRVQRFTPDLAIEIASPNDTHDSLAHKKDLYRRCGTSEVWLISPEDRTVYIFSEDRKLILSGPDQLSTPLIPGFSIAVQNLFEQA